MENGAIQKEEDEVSKGAKPRFTSSTARDLATKDKENGDPSLLL